MVYSTRVLYGTPVNLLDALEYTFTEKFWNLSLNFKNVAINPAN